MAFNAKNLTYESNEPAFLRQLRSEYGGDGSARNARPLARPKRQRSDNEDDEPTYVDEKSHDTVTRAEFKTLLDRSQDTSQEASCEQTMTGFKKDPINDNLKDERSVSKQQLASIGGLGRKRAAKKLGADDTQRGAEQPNRPNGHGINQKKKKPNKKPKLSFEEEPLEG